MPPGPGWTPVSEEEIRFQLHSATPGWKKSLEAALRGEGWIYRWDGR